MLAMNNPTTSEFSVPMLVLVGTTSFRVLPGVVQEERVLLKKWTNHSIIIKSEAQPWPRCAEYDAVIRVWKSQSNGVRLAAARKARGHELQDGFLKNLRVRC